MSRKTAKRARFYQARRRSRKPFQLAIRVNVEPKLDNLIEKIRTIGDETMEIFYF